MLRCCVVQDVPRPAANCDLVWVSRESRPVLSNMQTKHLTLWHYDMPEPDKRLAMAPSCWNNCNQSRAQSIPTTGLISSIA
jgi:hypothetical protein